MKKDKKFLEELRQSLRGISKKNKDIIVLKYENIIKEEKKKKKKIVDIIKNLGSIEDIVKKEKELLRKDKFYYKTWKFITKDLTDNEDNKKEEKKKKSKKDKKKKVKVEVIKEYDVNDSEKKKTILAKSEIKKIKNFLDRDFLNIKERKTNKIEEEELDILEDFSSNNENPNKSEILEVERNIKKEDLKEVKSDIKEKKTKKKEETPLIIDNKEELLDDNNEIKKQIIIEKNDKVIYKVLGYISLIILYIIWGTLCTLFMSSIFAYLDGVKFPGIILSLISIIILLFLIIIMITKSINKKKNNYKLNLILISVLILFASLGVTITIVKFNNFERVKDVSSKYKMVNKLEIINFPENSKKVNILFNSEYNTQYEINYDSSLKDKFKIEVKYYEEYYDYFIKQSSNEVYVSLSTDLRDRLSVYINDIKENKIFDNKELKRYVVKITVNKKDYEKLSIQN